jgi:hypothetical protein
MTRKTVQHNFFVHDKIPFMRKTVHHKNLFMASLSYNVGFQPLDTWNTEVVQSYSGVLVLHIQAYFGQSNEAS